MTLSIVPYEDKLVLSNLIQLYRYDSSEFDDHKLGQHGLYLYKYLDHQWTEDYRRPFIVRVDGEIAGFVLVVLDVPRVVIPDTPSENPSRWYSTQKANLIPATFIIKASKKK